MPAEALNDHAALPTATPAAQSADAAFLQIDRLSKSFDDVVAVDNVSIAIAKGEIFALLGSSGCGKSTLLRMLAGFETPSAGDILLAGANISALPPYERPINMMFQSYALFPHLTVFENIAFGLKRDRMPSAQIAQRVDAMLGLVQLKPFAKRKPHQLSGGQQQRVALARSLAKSPQLLLLDEPLGALDKKLREQTQLELVNIIKQVGVTCVMVTHDQEEAMTMADRIAVMSHGAFLQVGRPHEIYETPNCRFVADFIGNVNLLEGTVDEVSTTGLVIRTPSCSMRIAREVDARKGADVGIALRPEKIELSAQLPEASRDPYNWVKAKVLDYAYFGSYTIYHLELDDGTHLKVSYANLERHGAYFRIGDTVWASWKDDAPVVLVN